jgi:hypothetical protein
MKKFPISWEAICLLHKDGCLKTIDVRLNKKGIAVLTKAIKAYGKQNNKKCGKV